MGKILMDVRKYDNQYELEYIYLTLQATNVKGNQNHEKLLHNKNPTRQLLKTLTQDTCPSGSENAG